MQAVDLTVKCDDTKFVPASKITVKHVSGYTKQARDH